VWRPDKLQPWQAEAASRWKLKAGGSQMVQAASLRAEGPLSATTVILYRPISESRAAPLSWAPHVTTAAAISADTTAV